MADVLFKGSSAAVRKLLSSSAAKSLVEEAGAAVKAYADNVSDSDAEYVVKSGTYGDRATALVGTTDAHSRASNAKHKSLQKAVRNVRI